MDIKIKDHELNVDIWPSKKALFQSFFGDFYNFIKNNNGEKDLLNHNITTVEGFLNFADWYSDGRENCYGMGFAFHRYFLKAGDDETIDSQPTNTFIGYCHKTGKYTDFISFLITFFAWWRNDEGCTTFDPYNHADKFFHSSWAALVDTCKLFYLSAETVYWWQSFRVKYALDNIPGVILHMPKDESDKIRIAGYECVECINKEPLTFVIKRKDIYNYWEAEEKKIKKVYVKDYKYCDPA